MMYPSLHCDALRSTPNFTGAGAASPLQTEFVEQYTIDDGAVQEDLSAHLDFAKMVTADLPEKLPTVRDFNRLRLRLAKRQGSKLDAASGGTALHNGLCGAVPETSATTCIREQFLSQVRVHALTTSPRATTTGQQSSDWIYCTDNARSRPRAHKASDVTVTPLTPPLKTRIGLEVGVPHYCSIGPDAGVWISENFMSASRLGAKDLVNPVAEVISDQIVAPAGQDNSIGHLVHLLPRVSETKTNGFAASVWAGVSQTTTKTTSAADVFDLNGDGFPDQIIGDKVFFTDPAGRFRCLDGEVWTHTKFSCSAADGSMSLWGDIRARSSQVRRWSLILVLHQRLL